MLEWLKQEGIAAYGLVVVAAVLFAGAIIGQFFGGIGDYLFGKKDESTAPPSESD